MRYSNPRSGCHWSARMVVPRRPVLPAEGPNTGCDGTIIRLSSGTLLLQRHIDL